jgi:hypothetical protein
MIDVIAEHVVTLAQLARRVPRRRGDRPVCRSRRKRGHFCAVRGGQGELPSEVNGITIKGGNDGHLSVGSSPPRWTR